MAYHKRLDLYTNSFVVHRAIVDVAQISGASAPNNHYIKYLFQTSLTKTFVPVYCAYVLNSYTGTWSGGGSLQLKINAVSSILTGEGSIAGENTTFENGITVVPVLQMDFFGGTLDAGRTANGNDITETTSVPPGYYLHVKNQGASQVATTVNVHIFLKGYYLDI